MKTTTITAVSLALLAGVSVATPIEFRSGDVGARAGTGSAVGIQASPRQKRHHHFHDESSDAPDESGNKDEINNGGIGNKATSSVTGFDNTAKKYTKRHRHSHDQSSDAPNESGNHDEINNGGIGNSATSSVTGFDNTGKKYTKRHRHSHDDSDAPDESGNHDEINNGGIGNKATKNVIGFNNSKRSSVDESGDGDEIINGGVGNNACGNVAGVNNGLQVSVTIVQGDSSSQTIHQGSYGSDWNHDAATGAFNWDYAIVSSGNTCKFYYTSSEFWSYGSGKQTFPYSTSFKKITCN